jgi:hypothetical protein
VLCHVKERRKKFRIYRCILFIICKILFKKFHCLLKKTDKKNYQWLW